MAAHSIDNFPGEEKHPTEKPARMITDRRYDIFCVLWVIATIFHMIKNRVLDDNLGLFVLAVAGVILLFRPQSVSRFFLFLTIQLVVIFIEMPYVSNHWLFTALVSTTILQAMLFLVLKRKSFVIKRGDLFQTFAPVLRIELIILYFFVVLHKLNSDFFNVDLSCATVLLEGTRGINFLLPLPDRVLALNAYFTIFIEVLIPLMLCFRKTRNLGILIGLIFHNIIAYSIYNGYYDFSSMIFALYFLFTGRSFTNRIFSIYEKASSSKKPLKDRLTNYNYTNFLLILIISALFLGGFGLTFLVSRSRYIYDYVLVPWTLYSFSYIVILIYSIKKPGGYDQVLHKPFPIAHFSFLLIPFLVFINGMSPYLGLKTEHSFSMFSNLRTEGGVSNHFFIPTELQIFDYQKDMVEIISSSDAGLDNYADRNELITYFQLKDRVSFGSLESVEYIYKGRSYSFRSDQPDSTGLSKKPPYLLRKLMRFRAVNKNGTQPCLH